MQLQGPLFFLLGKMVAPLVRPWKCCLFYSKYITKGAKSFGLFALKIITQYPFELLVYMFVYTVE